MDELKLKFFHICESAFHSEDKKLNIIGIFDTVNAFTVPAIHPKLSIVFGLTGKIENKEVVAEIISPNGEVLVSKSFGVVDSHKKNINLIFNVVGLNIKEFGEHQISLKINDSSLKEELFLNVKKI